MGSTTPCPVSATPSTVAATVNKGGPEDRGVAPAVTARGLRRIRRDDEAVVPPQEGVIHHLHAELVAGQVQVGGGGAPSGIDHVAREGLVNKPRGDRDRRGPRVDGA